MTPPGGLTERPAVPQDLDAAVALFRASDLSIGADVEPRREFFTWLWNLPFVDMDRDTRVLLAGDELVAYAHTWMDQARGGRLYGLGCVHPSRTGEGIGSELVRWMEAQLPLRREADGLRIALPALDAAAGSLLRANGYGIVRTSIDMRRSVDPDVEVVAPPAGIAIRTFRSGVDERTLYRVAETAFRDHWDHRPRSYASFSADFYEPVDWDPTLAYLAVTAEDEAVGELIAIELDESGYIASLGTMPAWRKRGVARALLTRAFRDLALHGHPEVGLSVDATNPTGAVSLYEGVGMQVRREAHLYDRIAPAD